VGQAPQGALQATPQNSLQESAQHGLQDAAPDSQPMNDVLRRLFNR
jgi:hypothetical protein